MTFTDLSQEGDVSVKEYESAADNYVLLLCFGADGPGFKISSEQGKALHSALLRVYSCVQS